MRTQRFSLSSANIAYPENLSTKLSGRKFHVCYLDMYRPRQCRTQDHRKFVQVQPMTGCETSATRTNTAAVGRPVVSFIISSAQRCRRENRGEGNASADLQFAEVLAKGYGCAGFALLGLSVVEAGYQTLKVRDIPGGAGGAGGLSSTSGGRTGPGWCRKFARFRSVGKFDEGTRDMQPIFQNVLAAAY